MKIVICGSTGSIGHSTLEVVRRSRGAIQVVGLSAHANHEKLQAQAQEFKVSKTVLSQLPDSEAKLVDLVTHPDVDVVVMAIVGFAALAPTFAALKAGKRVAMANKEALVTCGEILVGMQEKFKGKIIPVDSEHNSLFQALQGHPINNVKKLWITGSGGPFRGLSRADLGGVTVEQALNHPKWKMGPKITIDSATLMNKGLEFIEARWLFGLDPNRIDCLIHPQSIVHGLVEFIDGTQLAHLAQPDMKAAISYALYYPERQPEAVASLDLAQVGRLDFEPVDEKTFTCFGLARSALQQGGTQTTVLNAANEVAVSQFLNSKIGFLQISDVITETMESAPRYALGLEAVYEVDAWARAKASELCASH